MEEYIKENYLEKPAYQIAKELNTNTSKIQNIMKRLGLNRRKHKTDLMEDYIRQNYIIKPIYEIAKDLNTNGSKIQRVMNKLGLNRENYKREYLINNYANMPTSEIANHFNCSKASIITWARRLNLKKIAVAYGPNRVYELNKDFFNSWSSNSAYILGFTIGDGYIQYNQNGYRLAYNINTKDRNILEYIRNNISPCSKVIDGKRFDKRTNKYYDKTTLLIYSKKIVESLKEHGLIQAKTGKEVLPDIPEEFKGDFLCGFHDADGHLRIRKDLGTYFEFTCMNEKFLQDLNTQVCFSLGKVQPDRGWYKLIIKGRDNCINLDSYMTKNRDFFLKRKHFLSKSE